MPPVASWSRTLHTWLERLAPHFARPQVRRHALLYLQAVLSDLPRKNGWQIAEHAREERPDGMQRLLSHAVWNQDGVRDDLRTWVCHALSPPGTLPSASSPSLFPVLVVDESGFPKRGTHSAGVAPQYCGVHGRVENCQVGVFLSCVTARGHALIDRELYLPQDWCEDAPRRAAAHIPESVRFHTKPDLAQQMISRALQSGLPVRWVVADSVYGHSTDLRLFLEAQQLAYVLAVPSIDVVAVQSRTGPLLDAVARIAEQALSKKDWHRLSQSLGSKGERLFDWAMLPLVEQGKVDARHFLLVRRCLDDPETLAFFLVFAPAETPLATIVQAIGARWRIEEDLHACKDLGLDHYEVRSYVGWYRHITLVLLAYAFLVSTCVCEQESAPGSEAVCRIALTPAEVQHLLARLLFPAPTSLVVVWHWSQFRRTHQYWAGYYHRRCRQKARGTLLSC